MKSKIKMRRHRTRKQCKRKTIKQNNFKKSFIKHTLKNVKYIGGVRGLPKSHMLSRSTSTTPQLGKLTDKERLMFFAKNIISESMTSASTQKELKNINTTLGIQHMKKALHAKRSYKKEKRKLNNDEDINVLDIKVPCLFNKNYLYTPALYPNFRDQNISPYYKDLLDTSEEIINVDADLLELILRNMSAVNFEMLLAIYNEFTSQRFKFHLTLDDKSLNIILLIYTYLFIVVQNQYSESYIQNPNGMILFTYVGFIGSIIDIGSLMEQYLSDTNEQGQGGGAYVVARPGYRVAGLSIPQSLLPENINSAIYRFSPYQNNDIDDLNAVNNYLSNLDQNLYAGGVAGRTGYLTNLAVNAALTYIISFVQPFDATNLITIAASAASSTGINDTILINIGRVISDFDAGSIANFALIVNAAASFDAASRNTIVGYANGFIDNTNLTNVVAGIYGVDAAALVAAGDPVSRANATLIGNAILTANAIGTAINRANAAGIAPVGDAVTMAGVVATSMLLARAINEVTTTFYDRSSLYLGAITIPEILDYVVDPRRVVILIQLPIDANVQDGPLGVAIGSITILTHRQTSFTNFFLYNELHLRTHLRFPIYRHSNNNGLLQPDSMSRTENMLGRRTECFLLPWCEFKTSTRLNEPDDDSVANAFYRQHYYNCPDATDANGIRGNSHDNLKLHMGNGRWDMPGKYFNMVAGGHVLNYKHKRYEQIIRYLCKAFCNTYNLTGQIYTVHYIVQTSDQNYSISHHTLDGTAAKPRFLSTAVDTMFSQIPIGFGLYAKVYRVVPSTNPAETSPITDITSGSTLVDVTIADIQALIARTRGDYPGYFNNYLNVFDELQGGVFLSNDYRKSISLCDDAAFFDPTNTPPAEVVV
jgi:hypothetical protein